MNTTTRLGLLASCALIIASCEDEQDSGATTPAWSETRMAYSMGGLVDMIKADSQAIGYTVYY